MTVTLEYQRPASYSLTALEDRFEVIKEIGDGSFGSVSLARVRANGANVARRGTLVSLISSNEEFQTNKQDRNQDNEENIRVIYAMPRVARSHLPPNPSNASPSRSCSR